MSRFRRKYAKEIKTRKRNGSGKRTRRRRRGGTRPSSAFNRPSPGKYSRRSSRADWRVSQQETAASKQNELEIDEARKQLVENLADKVVVELAPSKGENRWFVIGKLLRQLFDPEFTEEIINKINDEIPTCPEKEVFEKNLKHMNLKLKKIIYYVLVMRVIALILETKIEPPIY